MSVVHPVYGVVAVLITLIFGCGHEPQIEEVVPYDRESARVIELLGVHRYDGRLTSFVYRYDLSLETIGGRMKARLVHEAEYPLTFTAKMTPPDLLRATDAEYQGGRDER